MVYSFWKHPESSENVGCYRLNDELCCETGLIFGCSGSWNTHRFCFIQQAVRLSSLLDVLCFYTLQLSNSSCHGAFIYYKSYAVLSRDFGITLDSFHKLI